MTIHEYKEKIIYEYTCGKCNKTWDAINFFGEAACPYCSTRAKVYSVGDGRILKASCGCKK